MKRQALIVFMRYPEIGRVKTRLARIIGDNRTVAIYRKLVYRTLGLVDDFHHQNPDKDVFLFFYPGERWNIWKKSFQGHGNLFLKLTAILWRKWYLRSDICGKREFMCRNNWE